MNTNTPPLPTIDDDPQVWLDWFKGMGYSDEDTYQFLRAARNVANKPDPAGAAHCLLAARMFATMRDRYPGDSDEKNQLRLATSLGYSTEKHNRRNFYKLLQRGRLLVRDLTVANRRHDGDDE